MNNNTSVKFIKAWRSYFPGEIAGFDSDVATTLVAGGVATAHPAASASATLSRQSTPLSRQPAPIVPTSTAGKGGKKTTGGKAASSKTAAEAVQGAMPANAGLLLTDTGNEASGGAGGEGESQQGQEGGADESGASDGVSGDGDGGEDGDGTGNSDGAESEAGDDEGKP